MMQTAPQQTQEVLTATSVASAGVGFLPMVHDILQIIALIVSITAGGIVIYKYFKGKRNGTGKDNQS